MAKPKFRKENADVKFSQIVKNLNLRLTWVLGVLGANKVICIMTALIILCITFVSIFSESFTTISPNKVRPPQNIKLIEQIDPMMSISKDVRSLESNGKIIKIDQAIKFEDGFKIPKSIFDEMGIINEIKIQKVGNQIKAHVEYKNTNQCHKNWQGSSTNSSKCKTN